jgi:hypothetical protein
VHELQDAVGDKKSKSRGERLMGAWQMLGST